MSEPLFHTIQPNEIELGDHVYIWRYGFVYRHHGIIYYVNTDDYGESLVLEFNTPNGSKNTKMARFQLVTLKQFRGSEKLKRVLYGSKLTALKRGGTAYSEESLPTEQVIHNAQQILEWSWGKKCTVPYDSNHEEVDYNVILRNCECLAHWCKSGKWISKQVERVAHWVGTGLLDFLKSLHIHFLPKDILIQMGQEAVSEAIERAAPTIIEKFSATLAVETTGNAIALIIMETIKVVYRLYLVHRGDLTWEEFSNRTKQSLVVALMTGVCATIIEVLLVSLTGGAGIFCSLIVGVVASVLGSMIGNIINRYVFGPPTRAEEREIEPLPSQSKRNRPSFAKCLTCQRKTSFE